MSSTLIISLLSKSPLKHVDFEAIYTPPVDIPDIKLNLSDED